MVRFGLAALLIALLLAPSSLRAHAYLVKSVPAQRATLYRAPAKIQLWFNERLEPRYSSFTVSAADGNVVEAIKSAVDDRDAKQIFAVLNPLPPGRYLVKFRVLSVDGHVVEDQFPFTIKR
jgi:methionine-rich copper-binding protein CopC